MTHPIRAVVLDWAGTMIDFGSRAPVAALLAAFAAAGVPIDEAEARADMGRAKRDHIAAILSLPRVAAAWVARHGAAATAADADRIHDAIIPLMQAAARDHAELIPGAADLVVRLRAAGIRIGSCTGYTREMMTDIVAAAAAQGYAPDAIVCAGETPAGRPSPLMLWQVLVNLGVWPASACVKVDDAAVGIGEGRAAGAWTVGVAASGNGVGLARGRAGRARPRRPRRADRRRRRDARRRRGRLRRRQRRRAVAGARHHRRTHRRRRAAAGVIAVLPGALPRDSVVTRWLRTAPSWAFALYGGMAAFTTYFAMYAYRKPFAVAHYAHVPGWPFAIDFKIMLVIAQVAGYALSKAIGIKVVSEMPPSRRAGAIVVLIGLAELALVGFAVAPPVIGVAALFANGLALGMIWGLVFGFLEGRRLSEVLGAILCASFILSSGVVKAAGAAVLFGGWASEMWMPALTGALFAPLLFVSVAALAQLPPPDARDEAERAPRVPMDGAARSRFFRAHAAGLVAVIAVYVLLTAFRDFRDNFAAEIWGELGYAGEAGIFAWSELPIAVVVLGAMALLTRVRDNRRGVLWNLILVATGLATMALATAAFQFAGLPPVAWMIIVGAGLYLAYVPFNALLFDRLVAATASAGNAGFLIYVADASGYAGSVALLLVRNFMHISLRWAVFLADVAYLTAGVGLVATAYGAVRLLRSLPVTADAGE